MMEEILRKERDSATAVGRDYARRPASYKTALSMKLTSGSNRKRSRSPPSSSNSSSHSHSSHSSKARAAARSSPPPAVKKAPSMEAEARMAKLRQQYGDASASKKVQKSASARPAAAGGSDVIRLGFS